MSCCVLCTVSSPFYSFPLADQLVLQRSELALLISADSEQDIISCCHLHNHSIHWDTLMALDAQTKPMIHVKNLHADPLEQLLNPEMFQMRDTTTYEPMAQPNEYDGPVCCPTLVPRGFVC